MASNKPVDCHASGKPNPQLGNSDSPPAPRWRRVLLKLSGEALLGEQSFGIAAEVVGRIAAEVAKVHATGVEVGIVVGGGNIIRGVSAHEQGIDRITGDSMGMLSTVINALALCSALEKLDVPTRVQTAIAMAQVAEPFIRRRAIRHLEKGRVVIFAAGTGSPFFTTDSAAALRANEIGAEVLIKATRVDGIYTADPMLDPDAELVPRLTYNEVLQRGLRVMDAAAISLCMETEIPVLVCNIHEPDVLRRVIGGEMIGSFVGP